MRISRARSIQGIVNLPGDKSISHRAAMLAAIANGESLIRNFADSQDCLSTLACLSQLGVESSRSGRDLTVRGNGKRGLKAPVGPLDCGNSGTTMRLLTGLLGGQPFDSVLTGDASLSRRPMRRVIDPLEKMGGRLSSAEGLPPISIKGTADLEGISYELPVASAQVKSCVLLAGLFAKGKTTVIEKVRTRDHTERMLAGFGVMVESDEKSGANHISIAGDAELRACDVQVPSDVSAATFFAVAAACLADSHVKMFSVGLNPTRTGAIDLLEEVGANIVVSDRQTVAGEPLGTVEVKGTAMLPHRGTLLIRGEKVPNVIDEVPILAILGTRLSGGLEVRDAAELRSKETDRIRAVVENLGRMGGEIEEFDDGFRVRQSSLRGAAVESFGDHRIAMAFAIAGLFAEGETSISGTECAAVSFPDFFDTLEKVSIR